MPKTPRRGSPIEVVNANYKCVAEAGINVRTGVELSNPIVGAIAKNAVVHGIMTAYSSDGSLRLKLHDGKWTTIRDKDGTYLRGPSAINQRYVCVVPMVYCESEVSMQPGALQPPVGQNEIVVQAAAEPPADGGYNTPPGAYNVVQRVKTIQSGDEVHAVFMCYRSDGTQRIQLHDGWWTTVRSADGKKNLTKAVQVDHVYMRSKSIGGPLRVRTGPDLASQEVGSIEVGEIVRGFLTCRIQDGSVRLKMDHGRWTSILDQDGQELLRKVQPVDREYRVMVGAGVNVRQGIELNSPLVGSVTMNEVVHGNLICKSSDGSTRLRLDSGNWTSIRDKDGQEGMKEVDQIDCFYNLSWPLGGVIGRS